MNKAFIKKYIKEIEAFCKGKKVEFSLNDEVQEKWYTLDETDLMLMISGGINRSHKLRIKPETKYVYVNTWVDNTCDFQHEFKSEYNSSKEAVDRYCYKIDIDYLSIAVKTEVKS